MHIPILIYMYFLAGSLSLSLSFFLSLSLSLFHSLTRPVVKNNTLKIVDACLEWLGLLG